MPRSVHFPGCEYSLLSAARQRGQITRDETLPEDAGREDAGREDALRLEDAAGRLGRLLGADGTALEDALEDTERRGALWLEDAAGRLIRLLGADDALTLTGGAFRTTRRLVRQAVFHAAWESEHCVMNHLFPGRRYEITIWNIPFSTGANVLRYSHVLCRMVGLSLG